MSKYKKVGDESVMLVSEFRRVVGTKTINFIFISSIIAI